MKKFLITLMAGAALALTSIAAAAQMKDPDVGGAAMFANKNIIQNAVNSPINKTLVGAVKVMRRIKITDEKSGSAWITTPNLIQSKGVIQVVDTVLMPN